MQICVKVVCQFTIFTKAEIPIMGEVGLESANDCSGDSVPKVPLSSCTVPRDEITQMTTNPKPKSCEIAVKAESVWKTYENGSAVLMDFNITVPKGSIYALLGSSGCGKTSFLNCVVGRQGWDAGSICVFGSPVVPKKFTIDSRKLGYMPQDLALQPLLNIRDVMVLYGRLYGMSSDEISERFKFLHSFLHLPKAETLIQNLSGGEQRRTSLALSILHQPELIILDEPTVGLDPLLRQSIWEYLQDIVTNLKVTVILTTHYIDEARRSHMIGLMRNGKIIAEESPQVLMTMYETTSLDSIVLKICKRDAVSRQTTKAHQPQFTGNRKSVVQTVTRRLSKVHDEEQVVPQDTSVTFLKYNTSGATLDGKDNFDYDIPAANATNPLEVTSSKGAHLDRLDAKNSQNSLRHTHTRVMGLIWATYLYSCRHPAFVWLTLVLPALTTALVQYVFGSDLLGLKFGIVNYDDVFSNNTPPYNDTQADCLNTKFSHLFLNSIPSNSLSLITFQNQEEALRYVQAGDIWGYVKIPANYTLNMQHRMLEGQFSMNDTVDGTIIRMYLDMSSFLGSLLIIKKLSYAYVDFLRTLSVSCGLPSEALEIPMKYETPVYGDIDGSYAEHIVPGFLLLIIFIMPLGACSVAVIQERNTGRFDRMRAAGMANWDLIITYFVTHGSFQIIQMSLYTLVLVVGFSYEIRGPIWLYIFINLCNAFCGLTFGFLIGILCGTELQAIIITFAVTSFLLPFSGAFWPIETLAQHWRILAYALPNTLTSQSLRSVLSRGVSITHMLVWPGLVIPLSWMCIFLTATLTILSKF